MKTFSIITVTKDNVQGLRNTYHSIQAQLKENIEWIVIDGGSSDDTVSFLKTTNANWISEADKGIYDAMNKGIERAKGDYIWFLNAGDMIATRHVLMNIRSELDNCQFTPDFIYGDFFQSKMDGNVEYRTARKFNKHAPKHMFTSHQAMIYCRHTFGDIRFDTKYKISADYKFTVRHLQNGGRLLYCDFPLCIFEHGGISQRAYKQGRIEQYKIRKECGVSGTLENTGLYVGQSLHYSLRMLKQEKAA